MACGMIKKNKYEIIAIFREELRRKTDIEIKLNDKSIITRITKVDFSEFHINISEKIQKNKILGFILHSDCGKIEFSCALKRAYSQNCNNKFSFILPENIMVAQRRRHQRVLLQNDYDFSCYGRYKNGENYQFKIKDISNEGCALISENPNMKFLASDAMLKNSILAFALYGEFTTNLTIKNVTTVNRIDTDGKCHIYYQISCQFNFKNPADKIKIEKLVMELIMENKRKKRVL
ncbi:PilZ domain-containing protein [Brenneria populi subsp. brevivirga]|uniref:flagellar brake protein n=1 Tax=Brenneria populi TaxID=1505588 RepID=UPI002E17139A|nr:PilZ domain-containing protein [Brenneria populi subsp. brevivirga]